MKVAIYSRILDDWQQAEVQQLFDELKRQNFAGNASIEYEYNWKDNVVDAAQCVGFVRGYGSR